MFSPDLRAKAEQLVARYPVGRSALLPLLHLVQVADGHLSEDGIAECAELLSLTKAEVAAVATFYTMYKREPLGRHLVSVCTNFACKVRGAQEVYDRLSEKLGVGHNGTTADGALTLEHAECLGNCEGAPVVTVDYLNYECMTPEAATELVDALVEGKVPPPTRGFPSPGIRVMSHRLAGLGPADGEADGMPWLVDTASAPSRSELQAPLAQAPPARNGATAATAAATPSAAAGTAAGTGEEGTRRPGAAGGPRTEPAEGALHDGEDTALSGRGGDAAGAGTPAREQQEEAAEREVAETGVDPDAVEAQSGYTGREMPTSDPDEGETLPPPQDPRRGGQVDAAPDDDDASRLLVDEDAAPHGIADRPQTEELGSKTPPEADTGSGRDEGETEDRNG